MTTPAFRMTCGKCGAHNDVSLAEAKQAGETAAEALTDTAISERTREACALILHAMMSPTPSRSLALARARTLPDHDARTLSTRLMEILLSPKGA